MIGMLSVFKRNPTVLLKSVAHSNRSHDLRSFASAVGRRGCCDNFLLWSSKKPLLSSPSSSANSPSLPQSLLVRAFSCGRRSPGQALRQLSLRINNVKTALQKDGVLRQGAARGLFSESSVGLLCPVLATIGVSGWWVARSCCRADCKTKVGKNRLAGRKENGGGDSRFSWAKLWGLLWEDIWYLLLAVLCAIGAAATNIQIPILLGEVTNVVSKFTKEVTGNFVEEMKKPAVKLMAVYGLQGLFTFSYISLLSMIGENLVVRLRRQLFNAYLQQDIAFFDTHKTGELLDRLTSDIQDFKSSFKLCVSQGLKATTQSIGCAVSLFVLSPKLSALLVFIPVIICGGTLFGSMLRKFSREAQDQVAQSTAVAEEAVGNVRTVRAFAMEDKENELYRQELELARHLNLKLGLGIGAFQALANIFLNSIVLGSLYAGGRLIACGELSPGDLMSFLAASQTIERSLGQMSVLFGNMIRGMSAGARVFEYIESKPMVSLTGGRTIPYHSMIGAIQFKDVAFSYPTRAEQTVLHDFNLTVPGGRMVALVGLSGGGKSTVAALLERFYEVTKGSITIDGVDIRDLDPSWLRGHAIGFINQEPVLFATSVMENIRYGRPDATDQEVMEAAKLANAHTFITGFPEGYRTVLGERGVTVSGGQKQRIAIARALIKNPSILILDEATSALDAESERVVQEALDRVTKGRTVVVIAHRLSTIRDADLIAVVSHGKIVELGDHQSLKKKRGMYWELIKQQELEKELDAS